MNLDTTSFLAGLLIGWLGEWLIDFFYWRRGGDVEDLTALHEKLDQSEARVDELAAQLAASRGDVDVWQVKFEELEAQTGAIASLEEELTQCRANAAALKKENVELRAALDNLAEEAAPQGARAAVVIDAAAGEDDLTLVQGIGPRFSEKLRAAGIMTYLALADADDDGLNRAIEPEPWQKVNYDSWREQARLFVAVPPVRSTDDDLQRLEGIGPTYEQRLQRAGIVRFADLAVSEPDRLAIIIGAPPWRKPDYESWIAQAKLAAVGDEIRLAALQAKLNSRQGSNLMLIGGLGESYNNALNDAGIFTYDQLASSSPTDLEAIIVAAGLRKADFESWIAEAKLRAAGKRIARHKRDYKKAQFVSCPQDLEPIAGVGTVYEARLYAAGIGSYWEVAQIPAKLLGEILEVETFQDVDLEGIRASAMALAVESNTVNRVWDGSPPDDFEPLEGIGVVYERRLYSAGICTYKALAASLPDELEKICQPPPMSKPDFSAWIARAKQLAGEVGADKE
jgi:predicted flap endonuclease-1-like 5' DNA nuclease